MDFCIEDILGFTAKEIGIKDPLFCSSYTIKSPITLTSSLGWFDPKIPLMFFVGTPTLNTIFHESVHFKQWESGFDFENAEKEYFGLCQDCYKKAGKDQKTIEWLAYYTSPWEVEARKISEELENKWRLVLEKIEKK